MIIAQGVRKSFGHVEAVRGVSFEIGRGQCVGLLGPNGAGKTTTIRMVTGYLPTSAGTITIDGFDTVDRTIQARRLIGYLPEATPLYPEMRVTDYLDHRAKLYDMRRPDRRRRIGEVVARCWLTEVASRRVGQLSKGYKQRVGLAAALVHNPPVLVLDEPTNGLDPSQIRETRSLIRELADDRTVLVSSHILPEIERTCDRVIIIARGRLRADGSPAELVGRMHDGGAGASGGVAVIAEVRAATPQEVERAVAAVRGLDGVRSAEATAIEPGWSRLAVSTLPGRDLREQISRALAAAGVGVRELTRATPSLEQVFIRLIEQDDHAPVASGGAP